MQATMTIDRFHTLISSNQSSNSLVEALRKLTSVQGPEKFILRAGPTPNYSWSGWA